MNEKLQNLLTQLNSSQTVSLPEFVTAIEDEPNLDLTSIFTGTEVQGSSIDWKNTLSDTNEVQNIIFYSVSEISGWKFSLEDYSVNTSSLFLRIESTDSLGSDVSLIITGTLTTDDEILPILISKNSTLITASLYIEKDSARYLSYDSISSIIDIPSLGNYYPPSMSYLTGLDCKYFKLIFDIQQNSMTAYSITSDSPNWSIGDNYVLNLTSCRITCGINLPFTTDSIDFEVEGELILQNRRVPGVKYRHPSSSNNNRIVSMSDGSTQIPSISDIAYLFYGNDIASLLPPGLGGIQGIDLKSFTVHFDKDFQEILFYHVGLATSGSTGKWSIIPGVFEIKDLSADFSYIPLSCDLSGIISIGSMDLRFDTSFDLSNDSELTFLTLNLKKENDSSQQFNIGDLSQFGISVSDAIPFINNFTFDLNNLSMGIELSPDTRLAYLSTVFSLENSWTLMPSVELEKLCFDLNFNNTDGFDFSHGAITGNLKISDHTPRVVLSVPQTGDWSLYIAKGGDDLVYDESFDGEPEVIDNTSIPLPSISDICDLIGIGSFADKLPSGFLLDGIELTDLLITFPKPTEEAAIHKAAFELKTTSEWEFLPGIFSMKDIKLKANIDFTGEDTDYTFTLSGTVEIAGIDLNAMVSRNADNDWVFEIDLDINPADKPSVKEMISSLIHLNLPGIFPDIDIDELKVSGNISDEYYRFDMKLSDFWDLEDALGLELDLQELSITGISDRGTTSGSVSGLLEVGDAKLNLTASLAPSGGAGAESHLEFSGGLANGSDLQIGDLLSAFGFPSPDILNNDTFEIDKLSFYFNTADGKAGFDIGCSLNINFFGFEDIELRGGIELHRENSEADWVGKLTGDLYLFSMRLSAAYPIDNATEDNIDLRLYLPNKSDPDSQESIHCQVIKKPDNSKIFRLNFEGFTVHELFEQLANLIIPGTELDFPWPWNKLTGVQIPDSIYLDIVLTPGGDTKINAAVAIPTGLINRIPGVDLSQMLLIFDFEDLAIDVEMTGELFTKSFDKISFDLISEDPPTPVFKNGLLDLKYAGLGRHVRLVNVPDVARMNELITKFRTAFQEKPNSAGDGIFDTLRYSSSILSGRVPAAFCISAA